MDRHGNQTTEVIEEFQDPRTGQRVKNKYIDNGQPGGGMKSIQGGGQKKRR